MEALFSSIVPNSEVPFDDLPLCHCKPPDMNDASQVATEMLQKYPPSAHLHSQTASLVGVDVQQPNRVSPTAHVRPFNRIEGDTL